MDNQRERQGRPRCLPLAHQKVCRQGRGIPVRSRGQSAVRSSARTGAIPYDVPNAELGHHGKECSFDAIVRKYGLARDTALVLLARIVNGADTDNSLHRQPEGPGLNAVAEGFRHMGFKDDHAINAAEWIVYDALYAYCRAMIAKERPHGAFAS
jgi:hypothetical protein